MIVFKNDPDISIKLIKWPWSKHMKPYKYSYSHLNLLNVNTNYARMVKQMIKIIWWSYYNFHHSNLTGG